MPSVSLAWTNGLKDEAVKKQFVEGLVSNPYMKLLRKMLEVKQEARRRKNIAPDYFKEPQWAIRRAYDDGRDFELQDVLNLISFDQERT